MRFGYLLLALFVAVCAAADEDSCIAEVKFDDGSTWTFNLTALGHGQGVPDSLMAYDSTPNTYYINLCGVTTTGADDDCKGAAVCQVGLWAGDYNNAGMFNTRTFSAPNGTEPGKGLMVSFGKGESCSGGDVRATKINLVCDPAEDPLIDPVEEVSHCSYEITIRTKYACGEKGGSSSSGGDTAALVILLIIICGLVLYFIVGAVYQKKVKDAANFRELIIHNEFWCSLPGLVKDGIMFIFHGCKKGEYITV